MKNNKFTNFLCSIPIILLVLYFIPFLGICLIIFRYCIYKNNNIKTSIILLIFGILILIPKIVNGIIKVLKIDNIKIPYLNDIVNSSIYSNLLGYSKLLIIVSIISIILTYLFTNLYNKLDNGIKGYMENEIKKDEEIRKEDDLKMQEKREKAKNTHVVKCPYCGSENMITEQTGICQFCRRKIQ